MRKIIQQIMALTALCWVLTSCTDEAFNQEYGEGMGYLRLELGKVDVEVSSNTKADAGSLPDDLIPATAEFMIDIKQGNKSVEGYPKKYNELTEGVELKAGGYTVIAYYGDNEPIQATPYFSGSSTVEIYPGKSTETNINAALANAMVTPAVSENLQKHYSAWSLKLKAGDTSMTLADKDTPNTEGYLFVKAGQSVNAVFEGTNILEKKSLHEWTVISEAVEQTKYVIQCDPDLSVFSNIQLTATAKHTYAGDVLTGTDVSLNLAANGAPLELVDGWNIQLLYNNTAIRTYTSKPENGTLMDVTDGWPYVPHASTLAASIHLKTGEMINLTSVAIEEIPDPEFTVAVSGNTSYSVYQNSGAEEANKKDGSSIFDINATATIASEISSNSNYSEILKVTYMTDSGQDSGKLPFGKETQFNSIAWQKHALSATVSFDGVENASSSIECDVTGLPYRAEPPQKTGNNPWKDAAGNNDWTNDCVKLYYSAGKYPRIVSPTFYIPSDIKVAITTKIYREHYWAGVAKGDLCIYQFNSINENEKEIYKRELAREETYEPTAPLEVTMSSSFPEFYIQYNYMAATGRTNVYYFNIDYK